MKIGIIEKKESKSSLKFIHNSFQKYEFQSFVVQKDNYETFIKEKDYDGLVLSRAFQKDACKLCDHLDSNAKKVNAINCIVKKNNELYGYNTEYDGILYTFQKHNVDLKDKIVLILGNGLTSQICKAVCKDQGAKDVQIIYYTYMKGCITYKEAYTKYKNADIIINATNIGMHRHNNSSTVLLTRFDHVSFVLDTVYNPLNSRLLQNAQRMGIECANGISNLVMQVSKSAEYFVDDPSFKIDIKQIERDVIRKNCNIVLIGMPGSGKTTIARQIHRHIQKRWIDLDHYLTHQVGKSISDIFKEDGEEEFRRLESQIVEECSQRSNLLLSTGGGVITKEVNMKNLAQNGIFIYIHRPTHFLSKKDTNRPLLKQNSMEILYEQRKYYYEKYADHTIHTENSIQQAVNSVLDIIDNPKTYDKFR